MNSCSLSSDSFAVSSEQSTMVSDFFLWSLFLWCPNKASHIHSHHSFVSTLFKAFLGSFSSFVELVVSIFTSFLLSNPSVGVPLFASGQSFSQANPVAARNPSVCLSVSSSNHLSSNHLSNSSIEYIYQIHLSNSSIEIICGSLLGQRFFSRLRTTISEENTISTDETVRC